MPGPGLIGCGSRLLTATQPKRDSEAHPSLSCPHAADLPGIMYNDGEEGTLEFYI